MKKRVSLLLSILLVTWVLVHNPVSGENVMDNVVILVSDNFADFSMAELVSNLTGYPVVVTSWGLYNPTVTARILSMSPREVIIIGGPLAVVPEYAADLNASNITTVRWGGKTRYDTNGIVIRNLQKLGIPLAKNRIFALGSDPLAVETALKLALKEKATIVYFSSKVPPETQGKIIVPNWWNFSGQDVIKVNVTNWTAEMRIKEVEGKLTMFMNLINGTPHGGVGAYINETERLLVQAKNAYISGNFTRAYLLANLADEKLEFAIKNVALNPGLKADIDVSIMEFYLHGMKTLTPEQQAELQKLMKELQEALKAHNYGEARRIRMIIITKFLRLYGLENENRPILPLISPNPNKLTPDK